MSPALFTTIVILGLAAVVPRPANADPAVARRIAALRSLINHDAPPRPIASRPFRPRPARSERTRPPTPDTNACASTAWLRHSDAARRSAIERAVREAHRRHRVPARLIRSVIRHESNFAVNAVSHRGAQGLMQLMPATARALGVRCAFDPRENILAGSRYLHELYLRFGTWRMALLAYNAGPTRVAAGRIPHESRVYAQRVLHTWKPARHPGVRG